MWHLKKDVVERWSWCQPYTAEGCLKIIEIGNKLLPKEINVDDSGNIVRSVNGTSCSIPINDDTRWIFETLSKHIIEINNKFFEYDYIGATWDDGGVGNGGFSFRSRKLYDAFLKVDIKHNYKDYPSELVDRPMYAGEDKNGKFIPEDVVICRLYKEQFEKDFGIKYAATDLADQFSIENHSYISPWTGKPNPWVGKSLGFHGKYGIRQLYNV